MSYTDDDRELDEFYHGEDQRVVHHHHHHHHRPANQFDVPEVSDTEGKFWFWGFFALIGFVLIFGSVGS